MKCSFNLLQVRIVLAFFKYYQRAGTLPQVPAVSHQHSARGGEGQVTSPYPTKELPPSLLCFTITITLSALLKVQTSLMALLKFRY